MTETLSFAEWLDVELQLKGMSQADLARKAGVSRAAITNVLSSNRGPGPDLCLGIAKALNVKPEYVFRAAGLLPPNPEKDELIEQAEFLLNALKYEQTRRLAVSLLETLKKQEEQGNYNAENANQPNTNNT